MASSNVEFLSIMAKPMNTITRKAIREIVSLRAAMVVRRHTPGLFDLKTIKEKNQGVKTLEQT